MRMKVLNPNDALLHLVSLGRECLVVLHVGNLPWAAKEAGEWMGVQLARQVERSVRWNQRSDLKHLSHLQILLPQQKLLPQHWG